MNILKNDIQQNYNFFEIDINQHIDILFVDDQWCQTNKQKIITAAFGSLQKNSPPYIFHYETAEVEPNRYSAAPVIEHIKKIPNLGAVFLDVIFGASYDRLGLDILEEIRFNYPTLPVFIMTTLTNETETIERAMELGANEYLYKKPTLEDVENVLRIYTQPHTEEYSYAIWGNSSEIRRVRALISSVSIGGTASVLITGESGTGKELVARAIYRQGPRRWYNFISTNCAYKNHSLLEAELFGHEKGAFTGADKQRPGLIERADEGILFLDEIGNMPLGLQGRLLRVLETHEFERLGGAVTLKSNFQLLCATNENPIEMIKKGLLREDFYYRINHFAIHVPKLNDRAGDIKILAEHFLSNFKSYGGASYKGKKMSDEFMNKLMQYSWPGNARELKNVIEGAVIRSKSEVIDVNCFPSDFFDLKGKYLEDEKEFKEKGHSNLPLNVRDWPKYRLCSEIKIAIEVKKRIQEYKGNHWKAEFMRLLYPENKAQSAKGFNDLIRRLTKSPWGDPNYQNDEKIKELMDELMK